MPASIHRAGPLHAFVLGALVVLTPALGAAPAAAQTLEDCVAAEDAARKIALCTAVIASAGQPPQARAQAYFQRARAHRARGENRQAMNDFHAAASLNTTDQRMLRCTADAILAADADNRRAPSEPPLAFCTLRPAARP